MNIFNEKIDNANSICILGHERPDGDCIGATLAIYNYILNKYGEKKIVKPFLDYFSPSFNILPNADKISNDTMDANKYDLAIIVDSSSLDRLNEYKRYFVEAKDSILIDHHENNTFPSKVSIVFPESIATCEVLYSFLEKEYIDINVAKCLYLGIATDSGVFRYRATSNKTFEIVSKLVSFGFDFTNMLDTIVFDNTLNQRKAQGIAFDRLKLICKGQVSFSYLNEEDMISLNIDKRDIDNIIVYLREIENIKVAAFAYQVGRDIYKLSLRSKFDSIDVSEFAMLHEGGGHKLAAGCVYHGSIDKVETNFTKDIGEFILGK